MAPSGYSYKLAYKSKQELEAAIKPLSLKRGDRVEVKLSDHTNYVFTYMGTAGDQITGISSLNGSMVILDPDTLMLHEQERQD